MKKFIVYYFEYVPSAKDKRKMVPTMVEAENEAECRKEFKKTRKEEIIEIYPVK